MKQIPLLTDFTGGEVSEKIGARIDIQLYARSCSLLENMFPMQQGGVTRRPGLVYVGLPKGTAVPGDRAARLIPFVISETVAFIIELTNLKMRIWKDNAVIESGGSPIEITTTWATADLFDIQFCQTYGAMYFVHRGSAPKVLTWEGGTSFTFASVSFTGNSRDQEVTLTSGSTVVTTDATSLLIAGCAITGSGIPASSYIVAITGPTTFTINANATATGTVTATITLIPFQRTGYYPGVITLWKGRMVYGSSTMEPQRIWTSIPFEYGTIKGYDVVSYTTTELSDPYTTMTGTITNGSATITGISDTSGMTVGHYVTGTGIPSNTTILSKTSSSITMSNNAIENGTSFLYWKWADPTYPEYSDNPYTKDVIGDGNSMIFEIASDRCDKIQWIAAGADLIIGTTSGEWVVKAESTGSSVSTFLQTRYGSAPVQATRVNDAILFVQGNRRSVREYLYYDTHAAYQSIDLTVWADHIFGPGVIGYDFIRNPVPAVMFVRSDGVLAVLTYDKTMNVQAWARWETDGEIESVAVIPDEDRDIAYFVVNRDGTRYIEYLEEPFKDDMTDLVLLDSATITESAGVTISGLSRFGSGATVSYTADGEYIGTLTVSAGGTVTIPTASQGKRVVVGLPYTALIKTNRVNVQGIYGTSQMQPKKVAAVSLRVYKSGVFKVGYVNTDSVMDTAVLSEDPFTGDVRVGFQGTWDNDGFVIIKSAEPRPLTILSIAPEVLT